MWRSVRPSPRTCRTSPPPPPHYRHCNTHMLPTAAMHMAVATSSSFALHVACVTRTPSYHRSPRVHLSNSGRAHARSFSSFSFVTRKALVLVAIGHTFQSTSTRSPYHRIPSSAKQIRAGHGRMYVLTVPSHSITSNTDTLGTLFVGRSSLKQQPKSHRLTWTIHCF
jgi:hypothetical protein